MTARLAGRLLSALLTILGTTAVVFVLTHAVPADPVAAYVGPRADPETRERVRRELGLDAPLWRQYLGWLGRLCRGDLGTSYVTEEPVAGAILARFPATLAVTLGGLAVQLLIGVPLGVLTARFRGGWFDRGVFLLCTVGVSIPAFWLGRLLQFQIAYREGLLPVAGLLSWKHLILPALTLGLAGAGTYARLMHTGMAATLDQDFIRAARARGLPERLVLGRHALRSALLPLVTVVGLDAASLLGGVVLVETIFALPGVGSLAVQAVLAVDVPMVLGTVLLSALLVVTLNIGADVVCRIIDPRIR